MLSVNTSVRGALSVTMNLQILSSTDTRTEFCSVVRDRTLFMFCEQVIEDVDHELLWSRRIVVTHMTMNQISSLLVSERLDDVTGQHLCPAASCVHEVFMSQAGAEDICCRSTLTRLLRSEVSPQGTG